MIKKFKKLSTPWLIVLALVATSCSDNLSENVPNTNEIGQSLIFKKGPVSSSSCFFHRCSFTHW